LILKKMADRVIKTDVLIIGGGVAGCACNSCHVHYMEKASEGGSHPS